MELNPVFPCPKSLLQSHFKSDKQHGKTSVTLVYFDGRKIQPFKTFHKSSPKIPAIQHGTAKTPFPRKKSAPGRTKTHSSYQTTGAVASLVSAYVVVMTTTLYKTTTNDHNYYNHFKKCHCLDNFIRGFSIVIFLGRLRPSGVFYSF